MAIKQHKIKGSTLVESLTALVIVTTVMGAAFTLYEKTVSKQQQVMKTRARCIQAEVENQMSNPTAIQDLSNDFINVNIETQAYQQSDVQHVLLTITNKQGKEILKKNYLRYTPEKK